MGHGAQQSAWLGAAAEGAAGGSLRAAPQCPEGGLEGRCLPTRMSGWRSVCHLQKFSMSLEGF